MANPRPVQALPEGSPYHPKDAVKSGLQGVMIGGAAGVFGAAIQNSLAKGHVGAWSVFTSHGSTVTSFTAMATIYKFTKDATANLREKDDVYNTTVGAFAGGAVLGLRSGRMPRTLGSGAALAVVLSAFEFTGGKLYGQKKVGDLEEYERKEFMRKNRRRPIEETIADVGEARDIKPPGYEERRRERLREKYGIEIDPVKATVD